MPVSSVNSGFGSNQSALKSMLPQRTRVQEALAASTPGDAAPAAPTEPLSAVASPGAPIHHANRVGVAAYLAIMTPQTSTSMRTEA